MNCNAINLIFYLWVPENLNLNCDLIYKLHLNNLKRYSTIFTNAVFVLSCDNVNDIDKIKKIEDDIIRCGFNGDISFEIIENDKYLRESTVLEEKVIKRLDELDGITFFAHSKGLSNINYGTFNGEKVDDESLIMWINALYYFNLSTFERVKNTLLGDIRIMYGALLSTNNTMWNKLTWQFNGSFFWINTKKMHNYLNENNIFLPKNTDRTYGETLFHKIIPFDFNYIESYRAYYMNTDNIDYNLYNNAKKWISNVCDIDKFNDFLNYNNELCESIGIVC